MMKRLLMPLLALSLLSCSEKPRFELLNASHTGIDFINRVEESDSLNVITFEYIYNGAGVGVSDLNNDGLMDLVFTGNQVPPRIYLNLGNFRFRDISSSFEDLDNGQWYSGVAFADINYDGWTDVYLTCTAYNDSTLRPNRFFINEGPGENGELHFTDRAAEYGVADDSYSVHAVFFDYDLDGDLDLYLLNNFVNERLSASYRPKIVDGTAASNDDLYRNNGDGTFTNVTFQAGILIEGFGLGIAVGDVNKDGYPDLYISNDYVSNDVLYINQQDGTFRNEIDTHFSYQTKSSMGNDMADVNNDGNPDMFTLDMLPEYYHKKKQTINGFGYIYYINDERYGYEHQYLRNMLHIHNGFVNGQMAPYSELGQMMGVYHSEWSWSPLFADFDNDGDKDLVIANGYPRDMTDKDWTRYKAEVYGSIADDKHVISRLPELYVPNFALENNGWSGFRKVSAEWFGDHPSFSYGASFVDLDNDGDLDYVTNNLNDKAFVFRNRTVDRKSKESHFLRVRLKGFKENLYAYGAKVELWSNGTYQFQEKFLNRGYVSSVEPVIHFGIGQNDRVDSIRVTWPGHRQVTMVRSIAADQVLDLDQRDAGPINSESAGRVNKKLLFTRLDSVFDYHHQQEDYIDFFYSQVILPHKFSQIGPRMEIGDLNGDGHPDILVGATNTLPTKLFLNSEERYLETEIPGLTGSKEVSEAAFAIVDTDLDGDLDIIALSGGYEHPENAYQHYHYINEGGVFRRAELPIPPFPGSVVRACDFDQDGDPDLFIGARVKQDMFPFADDSWILVNEGGMFSTKNSLHFNLGMVTDAIWSDFDGDGWDDLLVTREWNSLAILKNLEGKRLTSQEFQNVEQMHGIWYSIQQGDFDQDGDPDYILGNLGENHRFNVSTEYPLRIYALDLDRNGTVDPVSTGYWRDRFNVMREYPINYMDELIGQSQFFLNKYQSYTSFSYASMEEIFNDEIWERIDYTYYTHSTSSQILWNTGDGFEWERLPDEAQVSPIKKIIVRDLNGDSYPDAILAGNDHTYDVGTGYYDALKGIILLSRDGTPFSELLEPSESGFLVNGMVESMLWIDGEKPMVVTGLNRDRAVIHTFLN